MPHLINLMPHPNKNDWFIVTPKAKRECLIPIGSVCRVKHVCISKTHIVLTVDVWTDGNYRGVNSVSICRYDMIRKVTDPEEIALYTLMGIGV